MLTSRFVSEKQKNNRRDEQSSADSWREVTGFIFLLLLTSCQLAPNTDDKPKVIENPSFDGPESQGEAKSVPYIPGQEYQKFDYKIKRIRRKKRSGVKGRRKRPRVIRYHQYEGTAEGGGDDNDDVGLFTRLWRWIGSFFTRKTTAVTTLQQVDRADVNLKDAASLVQDIDGDKKQTDLDEKETVYTEKSDGNKEAITCVIKEQEEKTKDVIKECHEDSSVEKQKELVLENGNSLNVKDNCTNENVVSGCFSVQKLETHVLKKTDDPKRYDLVPLKQLESKPTQQTSDTTNETSSEIACCSVEKVTRVMQETEEPERCHLIPPKPLEAKQLSADTMTGTDVSAGHECRPVQTLETQVEPNRKKVANKVKVIKRKKRSGVKGRRKRKRVIRYQENERTAEDVDEDVGLFTRLWQWIAFFFSRQTTPATTLQQEYRGDDCPEDAVNTTSLLQQVDSDKKKTDPEDKMTVYQDKNDDDKEATTRDIRKDERKLKDDIKEGQHDESSIEQHKDVVMENENPLNVKDSCIDENVVSGCFTVQQLETHIPHETDDSKPFDLVLLKQLENKPLSKMPEDTTTEAAASSPRGCVIRRLETHVLQETEDPKRFILLPLKQLKSKSTQLPSLNRSLEGHSKSLIANDGDKIILDHSESMPDSLQKTSTSKTVSAVPLPKKQPEHKVAKYHKCPTTSWRKNAQRTTMTRDAELSSAGPSTLEVQPSKERSTIFKGNGEIDSRKQADFVRSRQSDQGKDQFPSTKRCYKPTKKSNPKETTDLSSKEEKHLSWRNRKNESAKSSKGHAHSTWGNQKKGSESHLVPSSNWRRSSSNGDMSSNWRKDNGTNKPVSKSQTLSWRKGNDSSRTSSNEGTSPYRRYNKETRAGPCESNWRMRFESSPKRQTKHTMERSAEKWQTSTTAREKADQSAKENTPKMTYAQAVLGGGSAVRSPPAVTSPARAVQTEARYRSSHGQRQRRGNPIPRR